VLVTVITEYCLLVRLFQADRPSEYDHKTLHVCHISFRLPYSVLIDAFWKRSQMLTWTLIVGLITQSTLLSTPCLCLHCIAYYPNGKTSCLYLRHHPCFPRPHCQLNYPSFLDRLIDVLVRLTNFVGADGISCLWDLSCDTGIQTDTSNSLVDSGSRCQCSST
jgi:hypothetical protein